MNHIERRELQILEPNFLLVDDGARRGVHSFDDTANTVGVAEQFRRPRIEEWLRQRTKGRRPIGDRCWRARKERDHPVRERRTAPRRADDFQLGRRRFAAFLDGDFSKTTGQIVNVDGGQAAAFLR